MARYLASVSAVALTLMLSHVSLAQTYRDSGGTVVQGIVPVGGNQSGPLFTPSNPGSVTGTFSASFSGFQPTPSYSYQSVTTTSATYALPTGTVAVFYNTGSTAITVKLGSSSVTVVAGQGDVIQPDSWMAFTVGSATYYAVVGNGGTSSVVASGGAGLPTGARRKRQRHYDARLAKHSGERLAICARRLRVGRLVDESASEFRASAAGQPSRLPEPSGKRRSPSRWRPFRRFPLARA